MPPTHLRLVRNLQCAAKPSFPLTLLYYGARFSETPLNLYQIRWDNINKEKILYMLGVNLGGANKNNWGESWGQVCMCIKDWFKAIYPVSNLTP